MVQERSEEIVAGVEGRELVIPTSEVTVVIPAKNEAASIGIVLRELEETLPGIRVIVVDDGSTDETGRIAKGLGAIVIENPYSKGNGAAVKSGVSEVTTPYIVLMDADGQHEPRKVRLLLDELGRGADLVVGSRPAESHASFGRKWANRFYNSLSSFIVGHPVKDLTSGFRAARSQKFREFIHLLPNGFSYPTTSTMAFFRAGYSVIYVSIPARKRDGKSHIKPLSDGLRFLLIIFKIGTLYSPLKLFFPLSLVFALLGIFYSVYTLVWKGEFTNMSALLISMAVIVFLIGLVSEQITTLAYQKGK